MKWIWETESSIITSINIWQQVTNDNTEIDNKNRGPINVTQADNMIQAIDYFTFISTKQQMVQQPWSD